jgi:single-strand DNA-binding protein
MSHSVTAKLNRPANEHAGQNGITFFVGLGEKNYDFKQKTNVYTNYDAALFAKDGQADFYRSALVEGAIVTVSGTGLILDISNAQYPKLQIQDAKLGFVHSPEGQTGTQAQGGFQQQAPQQQQGGFQQQQAPQQQQQAAPQQQQGGFAPQQQQGGFQQQAAPQQQQGSFAPQQQVAGHPAPGK